MNRRLLLGVLAVLALGGCEKPIVHVAGVTMTKSVVFEVGEKFVLEAFIWPENATDQTVSWIVEDPEIVSLDEATGELTALKAGTTRIAATAEGKVARCEVTVETDILPLIPDPAFRAMCAYWGDDNENGKLSPTEAANTNMLIMESQGITSLEGIEYFTGLTQLNCSKNPLTEIDVSKNLDLRILTIGDNPGRDGTFVVRAWFAGDNVPNGFPTGGWEYEGETVTIDYQRVD